MRLDIKVLCCLQFLKNKICSNRTKPLLPFFYNVTSFNKTPLIVKSALRERREVTDFRVTIFKNLPVVLFEKRNHIKQEFFSKTLHFKSCDPVHIQILILAV